MSHYQQIEEQKNRIRHGHFWWSGKLVVWKAGNQESWWFGKLVVRKAGGLESWWSENKKQQPHPMHKYTLWVVYLFSFPLSPFDKMKVPI